VTVTSVTFIGMRAFKAERAVSPGDESVAWVVVSDSYELHQEASAY
jgi:hypothetical protein